MAFWQCTNNLHQPQWLFDTVRITSTNPLRTCIRLRLKKRVRSPPLGKGGGVRGVNQRLGRTVHALQSAVEKRAGQESISSWKINAEWTAKVIARWNTSHKVILVTSYLKSSRPRRSQLGQAQVIKAQIGHKIFESTAKVMSRWITSQQSTVYSYWISERKHECHIKAKHKLSNRELNTHAIFSA